MTEDTFLQSRPFWYPQGTMQEPYLPVGCPLDLDVSHLMPPQTRIPDRFKSRHETWNTIVSRWFFDGFPDDVEFYPVEGIDSDDAHQHLLAIMQSWVPKHEYKEAAVAYLLSLWFTEVKNWEQSKE